MKLQNKKRFALSNMKLVVTIIPIVLVTIFIFSFLARKELLTLSKESLSLKSKTCANDLSTWAEQILDELNIYKIITERMGTDTKETYNVIETSYGVNDAYPYGLYMGDEDGNYFDSSGWVPDEDFVVTERVWYIEGLNNDQFTFGDPYVDAMTGNVCISLTSKVGNQDKSVVLATDVYLDYADQLISKFVYDDIEKAFFVTGDSRIILADSDNSMAGLSLNDSEQSNLYKKINELLNKNQIGQSEIEVGSGNYIIDVNKIENTDWYFVSCIDSKKVLSGLSKIEIIMLVVSVVAIAILITVTFMATKDINENRIKARTDPLTKLLNRDGFKKMISMALKSHPDQGLMIIIDMDNFKLINDQLGHPTGDEVLKKFAELLEKFFNRNMDVISRIGGDEFAVFSGRRMTHDEAEKMLKKFISVFHETFDEIYSEQHLSISIGGTYVTEQSTYNNLYQSADEALYVIKKNGKNGFHII